ncbi:MarR family winged helix-turn-helix transcriptional regulator [Nocardioides litoris]|uniref:MarR family winged helix-turn-helix transcriptional regulator n=1 Tax=Nocardioides litoris TaxID=1926648 RepID=UPI001476D731|nr:MarR family transcriptional regulator [Nocardioides litoris]
MDDAALDPLTADWDGSRVRVMHALHAWDLSNAAVGQLLARWLGLPSSDASALSHVAWEAEAGRPLAPVELAHRMGMTSGATSLLLDRLEAAGHVTRTRESADRRRVTLRPTPAARDAVRAFLREAGQEVAATLQAAEPRDLEAVARFLEALDRANRSAVDRLRGPRP